MKKCIKKRYAKKTVKKLMGGMKTKDNQNTTPIYNFIKQITNYPRDAIRNIRKYIIDMFSSGEAQYIDDSSLKILEQGEHTVIAKQTLGQGSFGIVYKGTYDNQPVAIKEITLKFTDNIEEYRTELNKIRTEKNILSIVQHPNILQMFGSNIPNDVDITELESKDSRESQFHIVTELCDGDCKQRIKDIFQHPPSNYEEIYLDYLLQIAHGMIYLHRIGIVHLDIKPENVFYKTIYYNSGNATYQYKIGDFGVSVFKKTIEGEKFQLTSGTKNFKAPEIWNEDAETKYLEKCDVYSYGIMAYIFASKKLSSKIYEGINEGFGGFVLGKKIVNENLRPAIDKCDEKKPIYTLITKCWHEDPIERPSFEDIKKELEKIRKEL